MSTLDLLEKCRAELLRNNVPEPYEITMPEALWYALRSDLTKRSPFTMRERRRYMGTVMGFDVYVDDSAPPGSFQFTGCKHV